MRSARSDTPSRARARPAASSHRSHAPGRTDRAAARSTSWSVGAAGTSVALLAVLLAAGCGGGKSESPQAVFAHAQRGLAQIDSGTVAVHVTVKSPLQLERSSTIPAGRVPWSAIHLRKLTSNPRRVACASGLECARADLDVRQALEAFGPAIPALPVDQRQIHDATLEVAIGKHDHVPHYLKIEANVVAGGLLGVVKAEVQLDLPTT